MFIKPVDTAIISIIPEGDPDLTTYLNELLREKDKSEQQNNTFWFSKSENPGKLQDHTPVQTIILKELLELTEKENLNQPDITECRMKPL